MHILVPVEGQENGEANVGIARQRIEAFQRCFVNVFEAEHRGFLIGSSHDVSSSQFLIFAFLDAVLLLLERGKGRKHALGPTSDYLEIKDNQPQQITIAEEKRGNGCVARKVQ